MYYLKYRPQIWADLDNARIRESLGKAILENNFSHAYLLLGSRGTGKTTTARLIAKTANCVNRKKGEEPCNKCDSCKAITSGNSIDVLEIDAASNTGVDDIRDLREKVKLASSGGKYKVYIIDEVHMLSNSAFNALLKTLEEPPAHVIFVLATTDPQKLPETITSRCLIYDFGKADRIEIKNRLKKIVKEEKLEIKDEILEVVIQRSGGSHRDAQKLLEQLSTSTANLDLDRPDATNLVNFLVEKNSKKALEELEKFSKKNIKIKDLIEELILLLRDKLLNGESVSDLIKKIIEASSFLRDSPIPSLPLEMVIVEWCGEQSVIATPPERGKQSSKIPEQIASSQAPRNDIQEKWPEILAATKALNHSLHAFLRAAKPQELKDDYLIIEVLYKFHKEKLEEKKNRDILEKVVSDIMGSQVKIKFVLKGG